MLLVSDTLASPSCNDVTEDTTILSTDVPTLALTDTLTLETVRDMLPKSQIDVVDEVVRHETIQIDVLLMLATFDIYVENKSFARVNLLAAEPFKGIIGVERKGPKTKSGAKEGNMNKQGQVEKRRVMMADGSGGVMIG